MRTLEQSLARIEQMRYIVNSLYQKHYFGPWHMVVGTAFDWTVHHYDGATAAECADTACRALMKLGEAHPHTPAQYARERVRQAKATGEYKPRIKQGPVVKPARVRIETKKPLFR